MKGLSKTVILSIVIVIITIISTIIYISNLRKKINLLTLQNSTLSSEKIKTDVIPKKTYTDSSGRKHVVFVKDVNLTSKKVLDKSIGIIDTAIMALNLKASDKANIIQATKVNFVVEENVKLKRELDSLKRITYNYNGKYLSITAIPTEEHDLQTHYLYNGDISWVDYVKKKNIFSRPVIYTDLYSNDTNFRFGGIQRITIDRAPTKLAFKAGVSSIYSTRDASFFIGPTAELSLGRFDIGSTYMYDLQTKEKGFLVRADFNLIYLGK